MTLRTADSIYHNPIGGKRDVLRQSDTHGSPNSLLNRISPPSQPLLLDRIDFAVAASPTSSPVNTSAGLSLIRRLGDTADQHISKEGPSGSSFRQTSSGTNHLAQHIGDGQPVRSTSVSRASHQKLAPVQVKLEEDSAQDIMHASEDAVEQLLASVLDMDMIANKKPANVPATSSSRPVHEPRRAPESEQDIIEECRGLLFPQLVRNARRREPGLGSAVIEQCARKVLTDEHCKDFVRLAREVHIQTQQKERGAVLQTSAVRKRTHETDEMEVDHSEKETKSRRLDSPPSAARAEGKAHSSSAVVAPQVGVPSSLAAKIPTGPRAMLTNRAVRAMEEYLASVSLKVEAQRVLSHLPSGLGDSRPSSAPEPPSRPTPDRRSSGTLGGEDVVMDVDAPQRRAPHHMQSQSPSKQVIASHPTESVTGHRISRFSVREEPAPMSLPHTQASGGPLVDSVPIPAPEPLEEHRPPTPPPQVSAKAKPDAPPVPHNDVPGLWCVRAGKQKPGILEITFEVQTEVAAAAQRWAQRHRTFDAHASHVSVHLLCLPIKSVVDCNAQLDPATPPRDVAAAMLKIPTVWPTKGTLVVEMNPGCDEASNSWLPSSLGPKDGPLDITACMKPGTNVLQLIQLRDMSDYVFAVHATHPPEEELARFVVLDAEVRDWARFYSKTPSRQSSVARSTPSTSVPPAMALGLVA